MQQYDVDYVRRQFPSLDLEVEGRPAVFLDGPGGTQTPRGVMDAIDHHFLEANANAAGAFVTSRRTDATIDAARQAMADFLGCDPDEIVFGANMTTLTCLLAQSLARDLRPGDEIVVTELDHEANRGPWLDLEERGAVVRQVPVDVTSCTLDWGAFEGLVNDRTRIIALGHASNAVGTVNNVFSAVAQAHRVGALTVVDAVHSAPHEVIDVRDLGCDVLICSAYKFFGPHVGAMYVRREVAQRIRALHLRTQSGEPPEKFETGTLCHEGLAGLAAAVDFIADVGRHQREWIVAVAEAGARLAGLAGRRRDIVAGMLAIEAYERSLATRLLSGLADAPEVTVYGPRVGAARTPTAAFTAGRWHAADLARRLGELGFFVWDGHFFALRLVERLGLLERGGLVRAGLAPYTTADEVERFVAAVHELAPARRA